MRAPLPLLVLAAVVGCAEKLPDAHVHPVLAAERAFSRTSVEQGAKAAFLANLADDAIVFSPEPTPGRAYYQSQPDAGPRLSWEPSYAEISRGGDFGYTSGPYRLALSTGEVRSGHSVTIWQKQDRTWKPVVDGRASHLPPLQVSEALSYLPPQPGGPPGPPIDVTAELRVLMTADDALIAAWSGPGSKALLAHATDDIRYFTPGVLPLTGRGAVQATLTGGVEELSFVPVGAGLANQADLGYTYGRMARKLTPTPPPEAGAYLRIWRRSPSRVWQVALELHVLPQAR